MDSTKSMIARCARKTIRILIGDLTDNIGRFMSEAFQEDVDGDVSVELVETLHAEVLLEHAATGRYNLALIVTNNMIYGEPEMNLRIRSRSAIQLVRTLTGNYGLPVIALVGTPRDEGLLSELLEAGALYASFMPTDINAIMAAFGEAVNGAE